MKKLLTLMLAVIMLTVLFIPASGLAQYDTELEQAITKAKTLFNITEKYDDFNYDIYKYNERTQYNLSWGDKENKLGRIYVTLDSDMNVLNYSFNKPYHGQSQPKIPVYSKEDGLKAAEAFIQKVNPGIADHIAYQSDNQPLNINEKSYYYEFYRVENGISYYQNNLSVRVSNMTNEVESYYSNWDFTLTFPSDDKVMSMNKAQLYYWSKLGLKLVYKLNNDREPYLLYTHVFPNRYIDAETGDVLETGFYYGRSPMEEKAEADTAAGAGSVVITPQEREAIEDSASIMSQEAAEAAARKALGIDDSYELSYINLYRSWYGDEGYTWNASFQKEVKQDEDTLYYGMSISLDAKTGEVLSFSKSVPQEKGAAVQYNEEQAREIAESFIKTMQAGKADTVEFTTWDRPRVYPMDASTQPVQYAFTFTRKSNGAYFPGNGFNLTVDTITGDVTYYSYRWFEGELPSTSGALSMTEAYDALYSLIGLELQYVNVPVENVDAKVLPTPGASNMEVKLAYGLNSGKPTNIDAFTGKLLNYDGKPYVEEKVVKYSDIDDSPAKKEIEILAAFGIALPGEAFNPEQNITQKEFLYLLQKSANPYFNYGAGAEEIFGDDLYNALLQSGILREGEELSDAAVTRLDASKYILRALGYDKVAQIKGIYNLDVEDADSIAPELYGFAAIAYGLNIFEAENGYFHPDNELTREQAALAIYNYLNAE